MSRGRSGICATRKQSGYVGGRSPCPETRRGPRRRASPDRPTGRAILHRLNPKAVGGGPHHKALPNSPPYAHPRSGNARPFKRRQSPHSGTSLRHARMPVTGSGAIRCGASLYRKAIDGARVLAHACMTSPTAAAQRPAGGAGQNDTARLWRFFLLCFLHRGLISLQCRNLTEGEQPWRRTRNRS